MVGSSFLFARKWTKKQEMYLHKTKNENYTPPCCYFSGELEVVECLLNKQKQRSIVKKDLIFTLNIPKIRCKTPWKMSRKWAFVIQIFGGWGTHRTVDSWDMGWMIKTGFQMINTSKIHELITYSAKALLSTLSPVNMRATLLRFVESWKYREKWWFLLRNFSVE